MNFAVYIQGSGVGVCKWGCRLGLGVNSILVFVELRAFLVNPT